MDTQCSDDQLDFHALGRRRITGRFDGGHMSSDGGGLLLREVDKRIGLTERLARCFVDYRNPSSVEHDVRTLLAQRVYALALAHERGCEAALASELDACLEAGALPDPETLAALFAQRSSPLPAVNVELGSLADYDVLLAGEPVATTHATAAGAS